MIDRFDLIVIGGGSAARDAAGMAARDYGARVALVERERWGGSCPNVACTPTKAYLAAAELAHDAARLAPSMGVETGAVHVDLARVHAWKDSLKKPQDKWVADLEAAGFVTVTDEAELVDARTVRAGGRDLEGDRILIATGSRTAVPPVEGLDEVPWVDHVSALELTEVPRSLLVVGAGAVGLEFGQAFARFGSEVAMVDAADRIAPLADGEASATLTAALQDESIRIEPGVFVQRVRRDGDETVATIAPRDGAEPFELRAQTLLLAAGRTPNLEGLNAEELGLETTRAGIMVDDRLRTSVPGVWAAGDVTAVAQFTPIAQYQARVAVGDMFREDAPAADYSVLPTAVFTDPELGSVGLTEERAREQGLDVEVVRNYFVRRFSYIDARHGLFKVVFDRSDRRVLGIHVVSRSAGEIVQGLSLGLRLGATIEDLAAMHHVFPTFGEGVKAAAERAMPALAALMDAPYLDLDE
ncbi:MAG TPA: NAD(P)/FAD-dependent oxidoreductase [Gaiellaceae bacterium]|nr:NAD(P)/FAD-dependent oxidoreductase [Gaiellaceae bacterium]